MNAIGTTNPDTDPALQQRLVDKRHRESRRWFGSKDRERVVELASTVAFVLTASLIAVLVDSPRALDPALAIALVASYAISARVEFDTGTGYVRPTEPILVVMLFLLPLPAVPLFVAAGVLLARVPRYLRREIEPGRVIVGVGDAWHAVGPTVVLIAAGATSPEWSDWPVYLAALAAQFAVDFANVVRAAVALGIRVRALIDELRTVYLVDLLLAPIGLLAAFACVDQQWAFLALLPLIGLIQIFSREREARIDNALTLSAAYRGTAHLLGEVLTNSHEYTGVHSRSVVVLAHQVGEVLELDEATMRELEFGALLHDVGKMAVPTEILNKPAALPTRRWRSSVRTRSREPRCSGGSAGCWPRSVRWSAATTSTSTAAATRRGSPARRSRSPPG